MRPTLGRIVIFHLDEKQSQVMNNNQPDAPAIVTAVWGDECVNLKIIHDGIHNSWRTSATMGDKPGQWSWPVIEKEQPKEQA